MADKKRRLERQTARDHGLTSFEDIVRGKSPLAILPEVWQFRESLLEQFRGKYAYISIESARRAVEFWFVDNGMPASRHEFEHEWCANIVLGEFDFKTSAPETWPDELKRLWDRRLDDWWALPELCRRLLRDEWNSEEIELTVDEDIFKTAEELGLDLSGIEAI